MSGEYKQKITVVFSGADKAKKGAKKVEMSMGKLGKSIIGAGAAYFGARGLISGIQKSLDLATKHQALENAFGNLGKQIGVTRQSIDKFSQAVDGTVSEMELMKAANQAMTLGVVDSEEGMAELFDTAQRLGQSLGVDTLSAVDSLVTGMGRQSIMMLDNLGIIIDSEQAYIDYADKIGKSVDELDASEKKLAFNEAALESAKNKVAVLGDEQLTAKDSIAQFNTALENLSTSFGKMLIPAMETALGILNPLIDSFNDWLETTGFLPTEIDKINTEMTAQLIKVNMLFAELRKSNTEEERRKDIYTQLNSIYPEINLNLTKETDNKEGLRIAQEKLVKALKDEQALKLGESAMKSTEDQVEKLRGEYSALTSEYLTMFEAMKDIPEVQTALNNAMDNARLAGRDVVDIYDLLPGELLAVTKALDDNKASWLNLETVSNMVLGAAKQDSGVLGIMATAFDAFTDDVDGANDMTELFGDMWEATVNDFSSDSETLKNLYAEIILLEERLMSQKKAHLRLSNTFNENLDKTTDTTDENKDKITETNTEYEEWVKTQQELIDKSEKVSSWMQILKTDNEELYNSIMKKNEGDKENEETYESFRQTTKDMMEEREKEAQWLEDFLGEFPQYREELDKSRDVQDTVIDTQEEFNAQQAETLAQMEMEQDFIDAYVKEFGPEKAEMLGLLTSEQIKKNEADAIDAKNSKDTEDRIKKEIKLLQEKRDVTKQIGGTVLDLMSLNDKNTKHIANLQAVQAVVDAFYAAQVAYKQAMLNPTTILNPSYPAFMYGVSLTAGLAQAAAVRSAAAAEGMDELVTEPTMILVGEEGPEYVDIEPTLNEGEARGKGINITFSGNVLRQDFIEDEALPLIKDALRKGGDIGIS